MEQYFKFLSGIPRDRVEGGGVVGGAFRGFAVTGACTVRCGQQVEANS